MKVCKRCVLPETFPGIRFNEAGVCNFCRDFNRIRLTVKKAEYRWRFKHLVKKYAGKSDYDVILSYSGGKDSTFTLLTLRREYQLKVLAFTMDNGFISRRAIENISVVTGNLGVDHLMLNPSFDVLRTIFSECARRNIFPPKTLERAYPVCTACMSIIRFSALRTAIEKKIPFIAYGWSPGQAPITSSIMKNNAAIVKVMQKCALEPLHNIVGDAVVPYFLSAEHLSNGYDFPYNVHPLAFSEYDEESIFADITKIGWRPPQENNGHSANCLLNSLANVSHKKQFGFHPCALELANLVRQGYLERSMALDRMQGEEKTGLVGTIRTMLGVNE